MIKLLIKWIILVISIIAAEYLVRIFLPSGFDVKTGSVAEIVKLFIGAGILALLNATLGKILKLITLPLNCLTLGLFSLVINAAMFMIAGSLDFGFSVNGFLPALAASLIVSMINGLLGAVFLKDEEEED